MEKSIIVLFFVSIFILFMNSCTDTDIVKENENVLVVASTRAAYNGSFVWDKVEEIDVVLPTRATRKFPIPWIVGSSSNIGVPKNFLDINAMSNNPKERMYSRENGWELVYSNLHFQGDAAKYFALYNKFTGILRFFFFSAPGTSSISNTNSTFIGFKLSNNNRLFNFTSSLPFAADKSFSEPTFFTSPSYTFNPIGDKGVGSGVGFEHEKWYGSEIEIAFDPSLSSGTTLDIVVTALQTTLETSKGYLDGNIQGSMESKTPTPYNLSLSLNNSNSSNISNTLSFKFGNEGMKTSLENKFEQANGSGFWGGLWNNIKQNARKWVSSGLEAGVKTLMNSIFSAGGTAITDLLGSVTSSIIGPKQQNITKVDLYSKYNIKMTSEGITNTNAWGTVYNLPMPGTVPDGTINTPLYNKPLGAWNISYTPKVKIFATMVGGYFENSNYINDAYIETSFQYASPIIISNNEVTDIYNVTNVKFDFATTYSTGNPSGFYFQYEGGQEVYINNDHLVPYGYLTVKRDTIVSEFHLYSGNKIYQSFNAGGASVEWFKNHSYEQHSNYIFNEMKDRFYCRVSFDLRNKTTNEVEYSFSKYFKAECEIDGIVYRMVKRSRQY